MRHFPPKTCQNLRPISVCRLTEIIDFSRKHWEGKKTTQPSSLPQLQFWHFHGKGKKQFYYWFGTAAHYFTYYLSWCLPKTTIPPFLRTGFCGVWVPSGSQLGLCRQLVRYLSKWSVKFCNKGRTLLLSRVCIDVGFWDKSDYLSH